MKKILKHTWLNILMVLGMVGLYACYSILDNWFAKVVCIYACFHLICISLKFLQVEGFHTIRPIEELPVKVGSNKSNTYKNKYNTKDRKYSNDYFICRDTFKEMIQSSNLEREDVLYFLDCLNGVLGERASIYRNIAFENEAHEIYSKLKSKKLSDKDYADLLTILVKLAA